MRHVRQYVILPLQAGSFPLIFLTGIPDVSQVRQRTDVVTSIIGASEVDVDVCGQWLASRILAVWPDKLQPPLRLCFEIHMDSKFLSGGERSHTAEDHARMKATTSHALKHRSELYTDRER
ncbi:hypothetical protein VTO73DRAFT_2049 [Trametes versicolor]